MSIHLNEETICHFDRASRLEWLEANGLGGWAASSVSGANTRRYHGLLVAAGELPRRWVLLSKLDEVLVLPDGSVELSCNEFPGQVAPRGYELLASFTRDLFPVFEYEARGVRLRKTVAAVHGENTTVVVYEILDAPEPFLLELHPFVAGRPHHALTTADPDRAPGVDAAPGLLRLAFRGDVPDLHLTVDYAELLPRPDWWYRFEYTEDRERGFDFQEDLWTPGPLVLEVRPGDRFGVTASTEDPAGRDALELFARERRRREKLLGSLAVEDRLSRALTLAADQLVVSPGGSQRAILAGYPWYGIRTRDALIALPGLCFQTGRTEDGQKVLRAIARSWRAGALADAAPETAGVPEDILANPAAPADTPLWLFVTAFRYLQVSGDEKFVRATLPVLRKVLAVYDGGIGTVRVAEDGLVETVDPERAWTWMDARVGGRPVTPRPGKAVDVNALWCNALAILSDFETRLGDSEAGRNLARRATDAKKRFVELFWDEEGGYLLDAVDGDRRDATVRPNQVLAVGLPFPLLTKPRAMSLLRKVEDTLYTPGGLRTLDPGHPDYIPSYTGDPETRDGATHQGTAWPWLLGPFFTGLVRFRGAAGRRRALDMARVLFPELALGCVGTLAEMYDGGAPHRPRGCVAFAASVGEVLRAYLEDVRTPEEAPSPAARAPRRRKRTPEE